MSCYKRVASVALTIVIIIVASIALIMTTATDGLVAFFMLFPMGAMLLGCVLHAVVDAALAHVDCTCKINLAGGPAARSPASRERF